MPPPSSLHFNNSVTNEDHSISHKSSVSQRFNYLCLKDNVHYFGHFNTLQGVERSECDDKIHL